MCLVGIGFDMKTMLYSWFVVIIGVIVHSFWFNYTKDYIDKEQEKIRFLYKELDYLINSVIEGENTSYKVTDIVISCPRKIQVDEWEVSIETDWDGSFPGSRDRTTTFKVLNISDTELERTMNNKKGLNSFINPGTSFYVHQLNPDVLKK